MNAQPAPLTPPDCDLRGYKWMPLFGARLFASNFEAHASDLAFRIAIKLYWECWLQVPAASLPNDDVQLCRLAGLGRDLKLWRKLRADGVLHGFILCSDDRLYHGMLADEAIQAWENRQQKDRERATSRERMRRWRNDAGLSPQAWEELRAAIFTRDDGRCVDCGSTTGLHCDHITPLAFGGTNDESNLATRCSQCHGRKTAKQQNPNKRRDVTAHIDECEPPGKPKREPDVSVNGEPRARDLYTTSTRQERAPPYPPVTGGEAPDGAGSRPSRKSRNGQKAQQIPWRSGAIQLVYEQGMAARAEQDAEEFHDFKARLRRVGDGTC